MRGNFFLDRRTRVDTERAIALYEQALALDPALGPAWAMLASAFVTQAVQKWVPAMDGVNKAQKAVSRALVIDPGLACAHEMLGLVCERFYWNWARTFSELKRARELDPNDDRVSMRQAMSGAIFGRFDEAVALLRHVLSRNPLDTVALNGLGWVQFAAGRLEDSVFAYKDLLSLNPAYHGGSAALALSFVFLHEHAAALRAVEAESDQMARQFVLPIVLWALGRHDDSAAALRTLKEDYAAVGAYQIAQNHGFRGEVDAAFEWLDRAFGERDPSMPLLRVDPLLRALHADARFAALLAKMKLAR
jgi:tetratricopeptide (TPR) repeat protein